jgi:O-antigen/teichoic acid export membrane protein
MLDATAVTIYAIPVILIEQFRVLAQSTQAVLTPRLSSLSVDDDAEMMRTLLLKWAGLGQILALALGLPLLVTGGDFVQLWMGAEFVDCGSVLLILTIPFFAVLPAQGFISLLFAIDRHALYARLSVVEAVTNLVLSIVLAWMYGIVGVALGTLIPGVVFRGILLPLLSIRFVGISPAEYFRDAGGRFLFLAALHGGVLLSLRATIGASSWGSFVLNNGLGVIIFVAVTYRFWIGEDDRAYIRRRLGMGGQESGG